MPRTARQRAFLYAATAFATLSLLYGNSEHHVPVVQRAIRRYRRRYELEVMRGYSDSMINNMQLGDGVRFYGFLRMSSMEFEYLLRLVAPSIKRQDTNYQPATTPTVMLAVTIRFLASGDSYTSLGYTFNISKQLISTFVIPVCEALIAALKELGYVKVSIL